MATRAPDGLHRVTFEQIRYDVADGVCTLTLSRPEKLNAVTSTMIDELIAAFDRIDADDTVRAVIVTGAGRAFCAGADLSRGGRTFDSAARGDRAARERPEAADEHRDGGGRVTLRIFDLKKPVIAAINGPAVGFGVTMTLAMDIRLASTAARLGFVFAADPWRRHPGERVVLPESGDGSLPGGAAARRAAAHGRLPGLRRRGGGHLRSAAAMSRIVYTMTVTLCIA